MYDEEGMVFGYPTIVEADVVIKDETHILVEVKSRADPEDVYKLHRLGELYQKKTGVKPSLAIYCRIHNRESSRGSGKTRHNNLQLLGRKIIHYNPLGCRKIGLALVTLGIFGYILRLAAT